MLKDGSENEPARYTAFIGALARGGALDEAEELVRGARRLQIPLSKEYTKDE